MHREVDPGLIDTFNVLQVPHFLGAASFLFAIALFILPIEQAMQKPGEFMFAVNSAFLWTTVVNVCVGCIGFLLWGYGVQDVIVNNLQPSGFTTVVKLLLFIDISFTFPIVLAPGREFLENLMLKNQDGTTALAASAAPRPPERSGLTVHPPTDRPQAPSGTSRRATR